MISLLAAVPQETQLIRAAMKHATEESAYGLSFYRGLISGLAICLTHSGIGKAAAAAATVSLIAHCQPESLWLFGCGGAYPAAGLTIGDLALASCEVFGDEGVASAGGFSNFAELGLVMREDDEPRYNVWPTDFMLYNWAKDTLPELQPGPFVTVSTCTGTTTRAAAIEQQTAGICENMEGAAVALACRQLSIPLLEVRGISNLVEDRDTSRWDLPAGMNAAQQAILKLLAAKAK